MSVDELRFRQAMTEAANRAEATALLVRCRYRVYRPEADLEGEDLVVRTPAGELHGVQLKGRPIVDWKRYGARDLWMLFPSAAYVRNISRSWFLIPHDHLFDWAERRHGKAPKWDGHWSYPTISKDLAAFIAEYEVVEGEADGEPKLIAAPTLVDLPSDGDAEAIFAFAMSFDGYARLGSFEASAEAATARRRSSLDDIRNELFFSARASRHGGDDEFVRTYGELLPLLREWLGERRARLR